MLVSILSPGFDVFSWFHQRSTYTEMSINETSDIMETAFNKTNISAYGRSHEQTITKTDEMINKPHPEAYHENDT